MKYPYHVKANGRYYAPGEEVEEETTDSKQEKTETPPPEKPKTRRGRKSE